MDKTRTFLAVTVAVVAAVGVAAAPGAQARSGDVEIQCHGGAVSIGEEYWASDVTIVDECQTVVVAYGQLKVVAGDVHTVLFTAEATQSQLRAHAITGTVVVAATQADVVWETGQPVVVDIGGQNTINVSGDGDPATVTQNHDEQAQAVRDRFRPDTVMTCHGGSLIVDQNQKHILVTDHCKSIVLVATQTTILANDVEMVVIPRGADQSEVYTHGLTGQVVISADQADAYWETGKPHTIDAGTQNTLGGYQR